MNSEQTAPIVNHNQTHVSAAVSTVTVALRHRAATCSVTLKISKWLTLLLMPDETRMSDFIAQRTSKNKRGFYRKAAASSAVSAVINFLKFSLKILNWSFQPVLCELNVFFPYGLLAQPHRPLIHCIKRLCYLLLRYFEEDFSVRVKTSHWNHIEPWWNQVGALCTGLVSTSEEMISLWLKERNESWSD